jgi:lysine 6-dehydrogenase
MGYNYCVLGAGRQGAALAYDLAKNCDAARVTLADVEESNARRAVARLQKLLPDTACRFVATACDVADVANVRAAVAGATVVLSAVPFRFNVALTDAAIEAGASFCDLGGNTGVVEQQLARHARAVAAGISIVPDCGLAPGLGNILAADGIASLDEPQHVHVRCGGLPERPVGPLGYKLVFNLQGLINEYRGHGEFLRDGRRVAIPSLTELEEIEFPPPLGR